jgi:hypothetical protein
MQVDFKDIAAILGKSKNRRVFQLVAAVEFKLETVSITGKDKRLSRIATHSLDVFAAPSYGYHRFIGYFFAVRNV